MASSSSLSCYHSLSLSEYFEMLRVVFFSLVSQWVVLVSCVYPMLRSGRLPLAPCQFVFSPSLWLTAYLSTVKVVHCAYCSTLCIHCQDDFFLPVLSVVLPLSRESVTSRVLNVRCSEFFHHAIHTCSTDSIFRIGAVALRRSVRVILDCPHCITTCIQKSTPNLHFFEKKFLFAWYTIPP